MEESKPDPVAEQKPERKRSFVERLMVWGGILVLLMVLLVEWTSRKQYEATFKSLETAFNSRDKEGRPQKLSLDDVNKMIQGYVIRSEESIEIKGLPYKGKETSKKQQRTVLTWPSLFKAYKIGLVVGENGQLDYFEAILPGS